MNNKKGASFGSIVSIIGAILIALGFAWLLADNWKSIPDFLKVVILVGLTIIAYVVAIILKEKEMPEIAKSLFVVGALLYTLSIFLIAQIYNLSTSLQANAWLMFISFFGVIFSAYLFYSYTSLLIGLVEFLFWITIQFGALIFPNSFHGFGSGSFSLVYFLFMFLIAGIFFYSISLIHRNFSHKFSKLYTFWTVFYFLIIVYIISFQFAVQTLWAGENNIPGAGLIFLSFFGLISVVMLFIGIFLTFNSNQVNGKEILGVFISLFMIIILIFTTSISSNKVGDCSMKNCYDFKEQNKCEKSLSSLNCEWGAGSEQINIIGNSGSRTNYCYQKQCYYFKNEASCNSALSKMNCFWNDNRCDILDCYNFNNQSSCIAVKDSLGCEWKNNYCSRINCYEIMNKSSCEGVPLYQGGKCHWESDNIGDNCCCRPGSDKNICYAYNNQKSECVSHSNECKWYPRMSYRGKNAPFEVWFIWIIINIFFILFILVIIGYGTILKNKSIINIGIQFFILDIFSRYIGFMMDLWGYTTLSILFIIGGISLIFLGWLVSFLGFKWRKKLISRTESGGKNLNER